jgi:hypothetical protein
MLLSTLCLASTVSLDCSNEICGYTHDSGTGTLEATIGIQDHRKGDRSTDYAINVLWVLGFISVGDGCTEAARLLGLLGLPNDTQQWRADPLLSLKNESALTSID